MSKRAALLLIAVLAVSSLITAESAFAESPSKPSVPQFTARAVDHSYVVQATTSVDPYTGKQITHPSYIVENKTTDITIRNQPFVAPNSSTNLYYGVRVKGHFEEGWRELYSITNKTNDNRLRMQSASENTVISIPQDYPEGGQVDFQVEAVIATAHPIYVGSNFGYWTWETSGWSDTQTITIGDFAFIADWAQIATLTLSAIVVLVIVAGLVYWKKRKRQIQ